MLPVKHSRTVYLQHMFLQRFISALLLLIFLVQTFDQSIIELNFLANRSYISKELCVNRDKPQMQCNGKCALSKQITQQEKQSEQSGNSKREKFEVQFFNLPEEINLTAHSSVINISYYELNTCTLSEYKQTVFHPPAV